MNIERASIDAVSGEIVLEVPSEKCKEVKEAFERRGVRVVPLEIPVIRDENECVHCGACVSICPTGPSASRIGGWWRIQESAFSAEPASWAARSAL